MHQEDTQEVRMGALHCRACGQSYPIVDGIAELLASLDTDTQRERDARRTRLRDWDIERRRPFVEDVPGTPWVWPSFAANVVQGMAQVPLEGAHVLDLGPGTCWSTRMLCERGARAVALDISTEMLRDGEAQFSNAVFFDRIAATMQAIPCLNQIFDVVFASASVHHASDLQQAFQEIARVLRPGGALVLVNEPVRGLLNKGSNFGCEDKARGMNEHIYRLQDYLAAARRAGLAPKVLFPAALDGQLLGQIPAPPGRRIQLAQRVWRRLPKSLRHLSLIPAHIFIGLTLILVGRKVTR